MAETGRTENRRIGNRRLRGRQSGGSDRKPADLRLCGFAEDNQENSRTGGRWLHGFAEDERSIRGPAALRLRKRRSDGQADQRPVPGGLATPETALETFGNSDGGDARRWRGSQEERKRP